MDPYGYPDNPADRSAIASTQQANISLISGVISGVCLLMGPCLCITYPMVPVFSGVAIWTGWQAHRSSGGSQPLALAGLIMGGLTMAGFALMAMFYLMIFVVSIIGNIPGW